MRIPRRLTLDHQSQSALQIGIRQVEIYQHAGGKRHGAHDVDLGIIKLFAQGVPGDREEFQPHVHFAGKQAEQFNIETNQFTIIIEKCEGEIK